MSQITFFRQARADGGIRTGVEIDGNLVLHRFDEGVYDEDPGLIWFIDLGFESQSLPREAEAVRDFLLARESETAAAIEQCSAEISATGIDSGAWPLRRRPPVSADGVSITLTCSAIRRLEGREIAKKLSELARDWAAIVGDLPVETQLANSVLHGSQPRN